MIDYESDHLLCIVFVAAPIFQKVQKLMEEYFDMLMIEGFGNTQSGTRIITFQD